MIRSALACAPMRRCVDSAQSPAQPDGPKSETLEVRLYECRCSGNRFTNIGLTLQFLSSRQLYIQVDS
jgi:hypothetical protein